MRFWALLLRVVSAATLAELLSQNPSLSLVASQAKDFPEWSNPASSGTLIVTTDDRSRASGLPDGQGFFYANRTIVWHTVHYVILEGTKPEMKMVFGK